MPQVTTLYRFVDSPSLLEIPVANGRVHDNYLSSLINEDPFTALILLPENVAQPTQGGSSHGNVDKAAISLG